MFLPRETEPWAPPTEGNIEIHVLHHTSWGMILVEVVKCTPPKVANSARGLENSDRTGNRDGTDGSMMEHTEKCQLCIKKLEALIRENYKEPVDRNFKDATTARDSELLLKLKYFRF